MKRLNDINEVIKYIEKFQINRNIHGIILHRSPTTNIRTIMGIIRCNQFSIKHSSSFDVCISLYDQNKKQQNNKIVWNSLDAKKGTVNVNTTSLSMSSIVNICLTDLRIINVTDYSVEFITSCGFDFAYIANAPDVEMNLLNEWVFEKNRSIKALWIRPEDREASELLEELVFKKKEPKDRYLNI